MPDKPVSERRRYSRGVPRPGRQVEMRLRPRGTHSPFDTVITGDIGVGGAFIRRDNPLPVGISLEIHLMVPGSTSPLQFDAEVRWHGVRRGGDSHGMGLSFSSLDIDAVMQLSEYFASLSRDL